MNANVIDDVVSGYLKRHPNAYRDISQMFIFLCGFNISTANKLSTLMNELDVNSDYQSDFQDCILSGYKEAVANKNTPIHLHLSHFDFQVFYNEDLMQIWTLNTSRARSLKVGWLMSYRHVTIRSQYASYIKLHLITCSSTWLRSLLSTLLTLDHKVEFELFWCKITSLDHVVKRTLRGSGMSSCVGDAVSETDILEKVAVSIMTDINNTCTFQVSRDCPGLWETLHSKNVNCLSIMDMFYSLWMCAGLKVYHVPSSLSRSLASLSQLKTLTMLLSVYIDLQLPPSLKHLNVYYDILSSSELRHLMNKLSACAQSILCILEFGCGNEITKYKVNIIPPEE
ncbi:hypothetical protein DPMN_058689 [Dreissena polymorpha]|uniref:Uncharacterized protein n=1 Tax=Dreissena polymorpha TaxID=45954 RepID=A0A9D4C275_DREPO|nr:hypothetical protein DPMN_058689 [Dreissena polymorpha]